MLNANDRESRGPLTKMCQERVKVSAASIIHLSCRQTQTQYRSLPTVLPLSLSSSAHLVFPTSLLIHEIKACVLDQVFLTPPPPHALSPPTDVCLSLCLRMTLQLIPCHFPALNLFRFHFLLLLSVHMLTLGHLSLWMCLKLGIAHQRKLLLKKEYWTK